MANAKKAETSEVEKTKAQESKEGYAIRKIGKLFRALLDEMSESGWGAEIVKRIEKRAGVDLDGDGKVGNVRIALAVLLGVCVIGIGVAMAATYSAYLMDESTYGTAKVTGDSTTLQGVFTADDLVAEDDLTVTDDASVGGNLTVTGTMSGTPSAGTVGTNGESVVESYGVVNKTLFTFANTLTATDGSAEGETHLIYTFPEGRIYILGGALNATIVNTATEANANDVFVVGIGTAGANDDADLDDANEKDIFAGPTLEDGAVTLTNQWEVDFTAGADSVFDGTASAATLNLNMGIADACITTNNFSAVFSGSGSVFWINLGDD